MRNLKFRVCKVIATIAYPKLSKPLLNSFIDGNLPANQLYQYFNSILKNLIVFNFF